MQKKTSIYSIAIPEYSSQEPDFSAIGIKLDGLIKEHFRGKWMAMRGISLQDHPGKTLDEMMAKIVELGTDRYDPERKGVHDDIDKEFGIELHAVPFIVENNTIRCPHYSGERCQTGSPVGELLSDCWSGAVVDRGYAMRINILTFYDLEKLAPAPMIWTEKGPTYTDEAIAPSETCTFRFKEPEKKREALIGVIKIL